MASDNPLSHSLTPGNLLHYSMGCHCTIYEKSFKMNVFSNKTLFEIKLWDVQCFAEISHKFQCIIHLPTVHLCTCTVFIQIMNNSSTITTLLTDQFSMYVQYFYYKHFSCQKVIKIKTITLINFFLQHMLNYKVGHRKYTV